MTMPTAFPARIHEALAEHVTLTGRTRVTLTSLLSIQAAIERHAATRPGARTRLHGAITALADDGRVEPPVSRHLWDHTASPPLPAWITVLIDTPRRSQRIDPGSITWTPSISRWVGEWARMCRPGASIWQTLREINTWMLANLGRTPHVIAREERSLDIFKDEKKLARIESTTLFAANRLDPAQLAYERPVAPMRAARVANRGHLLIVENQATFDSAWRGLTQRCGPFAAIAFGNGWEGASAEPVLRLADYLQLERQPERIWYVGDVDLDGLDIPQTLAANLGVCSHLRPEPLVSAYEAMAAVDRSTAATVGTPSAAAAEQASAWLPPHLRESACRLLTSGRRVPQETLDRAWWTTADWHSGLAAEGGSS